MIKIEQIWISGRKKNHGAVNISLMLHKILVRKTLSSSFSDEGHTLENSALETLYGGQFTL